MYWHLETPDESTVEGRCERSSGAVHETDAGGLEILLPRDNSRLSLSIDVVDDVVKRFGQLDTEVTGMLHYILMEHSLACIEDMLDRRGIEDHLEENWSTVGTYLFPHLGHFRTKTLETSEYQVHSWNCGLQEG